MKKIQQIARAFPMLKDKRIRIFSGGMKTPWAEATVTDWSGLYLGLVDVVIWNGDKRAKDHIHARSIDRIEVITLNTKQ